MSDITFIVEGQRVYAHKLMLMRCSYSQALFLEQMRESQMDQITRKQVRHPVFLSILEYLYTDQLTICFALPDLKLWAKNAWLQSITGENAATIFHATDLHSATALRHKAKPYILSNFEEVSKSRGFEEMGRHNVEHVFEFLQSR